MSQLIQIIILTSALLTAGLTTTLKAENNATIQIKEKLEQLKTWSEPDTTHYIVIP